MNAHTRLELYNPKLVSSKAFTTGCTHWVDFEVAGFGTKITATFDSHEEAQRFELGLRMAFGVPFKFDDRAADEYPEYTRACDAADSRHQFKMEQA